jgi:hypothetical protein
MEQSAAILWFVGIVALMVGGTLAVWAKELFTVPTYAAIAALVVSGFCIVRGLALAARAKLGLGRAPATPPPAREPLQPQRDPVP